MLTGSSWLWNPVSPQCSGKDSRNFSLELIKSNSNNPIYRLWLSTKSTVQVTGIKIDQLQMSAHFRWEISNKNYVKKSVFLYIGDWDQSKRLKDCVPQNQKLLSRIYPKKWFFEIILLACDITHSLRLLEVETLT